MLLNRGGGDVAEIGYSINDGLGQTEFGKRLVTVLLILVETEFVVYGYNKSAYLARHLKQSRAENWITRGSSLQRRIGRAPNSRNTHRGSFKLKASEHSKTSI